MRHLVVVVVLAIVSGCAALATPASSTPPPAPSSDLPAPQTQAATPADTPAQTPGPRILAGLVDAIDIEGTLVLGKAADGTTVLFDLVTGSTVAIDVDIEARPMDLSSRVAVGIRGGDQAGISFAYDLGTQTVVDVAAVTDSIAAGGDLLATARWTDGLRDVISVRNLETDTAKTLHFLDGQGRPRIAGLQGRRMAGVYGHEYDEARMAL